MRDINALLGFHVLVRILLVDDQHYRMEGSSMTTANPNPGSQEALVAGCTCPVLDNGHGAGAFKDEYGEPQFWINEECPIHGKSKRSDYKDKSIWTEICGQVRE